VRPAGPGPSIRCPAVWTEGDGPDLFGNVRQVEIDRDGRLWVLEGQSNEIRVFDAAGRPVRTIGRKGGGPGEFGQPIGMAWSPAGELWVVDPANSRISVIDTAGRFRTGLRMLGGFIVMPWPGGFDRGGSFYNFVPDMSGGDFRLRMVRYDTTLAPLDTLAPPEWQGPEEFFEIAGRVRMGVPFSPGLEWRLTPDGDFWFVHTGSYELFRVNARGDTVRRVTQPFEPVAVTGEDVDSAVAGMEWFTQQGGKIDRSRIPGVKPAVERLLVAEDGYLWVEPNTAARADRGRLFEVFDPEGRYLGRVRLPFPVRRWTPIIIRGDRFVAVTEDDLEVPFVVRARIVKPLEL
jgi:hypothetical protein